MTSGLTDHDLATSHAFQVMIEEQLIPCLNLDRYVYNTWNEYSKLSQYFISFCQSTVVLEIIFHVF